MARARWLMCAQCGGYGVSGRWMRFGERQTVHLLMECWVCRGRGAKKVETVKR